MDVVLRALILLEWPLTGLVLPFVLTVPSAVRFREALAASASAFSWTAANADNLGSWLFTLLPPLDTACESFEELLATLDSCEFGIVCGSAALLSGVGPATSDESCIMLSVSVNAEHATWEDICVFAEEGGGGVAGTVNSPSRLADEEDDGVCPLGMSCRCCCCDMGSV